MVDLLLNYTVRSAVIIKGQVSGEIRGKTCTKLLYDLVFVTGVVQSGSKAAQRSRSGTGEGC